MPSLKLSCFAFGLLYAFSSWRTIQVASGFSVGIAGRFPSDTREFSSSGLHIKRQSTICHGKTTIEESTVLVGDALVAITKSQCTDGITTGDPDSSQPVSRASPFSSLRERDSRCHTYPPSSENCQCGSINNGPLGFCQNFTKKAPKTKDCNILIESFSVLEEENGPTFLLEPQQEENLHYGTCDVTWIYQGGNEGTETPVVELCYADMATLATELLDYCILPKTSTGASTFNSVGTFQIQRIDT